MKVYLAGGFKTRWQERVGRVVGEYNCFDPSKLRPATLKEYSTWDRYYIRHCKILLAYIEADNPGVWNLAAEVGYAHGLGKLIILVDERSPADEKFARYSGLVREMADITMDNLDDAIDYLRTLLL